MEDRYEIRGKIGQGGLGGVYRAYDTRMNREVAIKRITHSSSDAELEQESTRQLMKEAGALAALQHPHIVTVYDYGSDEDGPYVVMELISGKTLDELIENAPLTWPDFRELALQTQEALIAAQELDLIHSDLKPSNLMLTWLPSGKFQVKIVDFGLATLARSQSKEDLASIEAVFGSVFFMAPEQFERLPLDARSDMYSIGCVYYQALTGVYPFDGKTGNEVMDAHLQHLVTPLQEMRSDIPVWACDWIMWHLNRQPEHRPESARDALSVFLQNDQNPAPTMSLGTAQPANTPKRPRLIIPGSTPPAEPAPIAILAEPIPVAVPEPTPLSPVIVPVEPIPAPPAPEVEPPAPAAAPVLQVRKLVTPAVSAAPVAEVLPDAPPAVALSTAPSARLLSPSTAKAVSPSPSPAVAVTPLVVKPSAPASIVPAEAPTTTIKAKTKTSPQPLSPPVGSKPSVHPQPPPTSSIATAIPVARSVATQPPPPTNTTTDPNQKAPPKKGLSNAAKTVIAAGLGVLVILLGWFLLDRQGRNKQIKLYNEMINLAAKEEATELPVTKHKLEILLSAATDVGENQQRYVVYKALYLAKASDGTNVDARIAEVALRPEIMPDVRVVLIRDVLRMRKNPAIIPTLVKYASSAPRPEDAVAALEAVRFMSSEEQVDSFLEILKTTPHEKVRKAAEDTLDQVIKKSSSRASISNKLISLFQSSKEESIRHAMLRLLGRCGGDKALALANTAISGSDPKDQVAAITSLGNWSDDAGFDALLKFLDTNKDVGLRTRSFDAATRFASNPPDANASKHQKRWESIASQARTREEQEKTIRGLVNYDDPWAIKLIESYKKADDDKIVDLAEKALDHIGQRKRAKGDK